MCMSLCMSMSMSMSMFISICRLVCLSFYIFISLFLFSLCCLAIWLLTRLLFTLCLKAYALRCQKCINSKWQNQICTSASPITTCPSQTHSCSSLTYLLSNKTGHEFHVLNRTCIKTTDCEGKKILKELKEHLWDPQEDAFVRDFKVKCCSADMCNPETPAPTVSQSPTCSTTLPTSPSPPPECYTCVRDSLLVLCDKTPSKTLCNSPSDRCFTLKAEIVNATNGETIDNGLWQGCATQDLDCLENDKCDQLRDSLKSRGASLVSCQAACCKGDHCNTFVPTPAVNNDTAMGAKSSANTFDFRKVFTLLTGLLLAF